MEKALFVSENRLVTVDEMISLYGIEKTREYTYWCEDEKCRIRVRPTIPQKTKSARRKAPSPYFSRRNGSKHYKNCCSGMKKGKNIPEVIKIRTPDRNTISSISDIPRRFIEASPSLIYKNKIICRLTPRQDFKDTYGQRRRKKRYFFYKRTREVKTLVRVYETYPKKTLQHAPLHINNSPAKTFLNAFRSVKLLKTESGKQSHRNRFVYFGKIDSFKKCDSGLIIRICEKSSDKKVANICLQKCSASTEQKKELWERIKKASGNLNAELYVLGSFQLIDGGFNLEVNKLSNIWISFPEDYPNNHN